jgi:hypothetical protein
MGGPGRLLEVAPAGRPPAVLEEDVEVDELEDDLEDELLELLERLELLVPDTETDTVGRLMVVVPPLALAMTVVPRLLAVPHPNWEAPPSNTFLKQTSLPTQVYTYGFATV